MKLAKVIHDRCNEYVATTYVWVTDLEMTIAEFQKLADLARDSYLKAERAWKDDPKAPKYAAYFPDYKKYPDKTVAEVDAIFAVEKATHDEWQARQQTAREPFHKHLIRISEGKIVDFHDGGVDLEAEVGWGHNHGLKIEYSDTNIWDEDFKGSEPYPEYP